MLVFLIRKLPYGSRDKDKNNRWPIEYGCFNPIKKSLLDIKNRGNLIKNAYLSWRELLRFCIADFFDIETGELTVDYCIREDIIPIVYMVEQLENGAGYTDYLASLSPDKQKDIFITSLVKGGTFFSFLTGKH
jgi:hypothetical protein